MELMNARGTRDFGPEEKIIRQKVVDMLRRTFEMYGFSPIETPIIERKDVLYAKYAGGSEILKETFNFKDQGERDLCLRYDLTVPLARFIGMNPIVKMPFKRYAIGRVYRDGPIKTGRAREFWQCDVDIVGSRKMLADAQCLQIAQKFFSELGIDAVIELNNRKLLDAIMETVGIPEGRHLDIILEIDKLKKIGIEAVEKEIRDKGITDESIDKLREILLISGTNAEKIAKLRQMITTDGGKEGLDEIEEILSYLTAGNVVFNIALSRGLSYYTGPVFEVFLKDEKIFGSSLAGGGRWDEMISEFLGSKKEFPAVGISFGLEPITTVMKTLNKEIAQKKSTTKVFIVPINTVDACVSLAEQLRNAGINTDMDLMRRGVSKNLDYADKMGIPYVLLVGEDELNAGKFKLKNMKTGEETALDAEEICKKML